jgi:hypothetical protein
LQLADGQFQLGVFRGLIRQKILNLPDGQLDAPLLAICSVGAQLQGCISEAPFSLGHEGKGPVATINHSTLASVFHRFALGLLQEGLDFLLTEIGAPLNRNTLLPACCSVGC